MENTLKKIREHFASASSDGLRVIDTLPAGYKAFTLRYGPEYGVAIEFKCNQDVIAEANNILFHTEELNINGLTVKYLLLTCVDKAFRNEFAELCVNFVMPGNNGDVRNELLTSPYKWWDRWVKLFGNNFYNGNCYGVLAELVLLEKLFRKDKTVQWTSLNPVLRDIETSDESYEVEATISKESTSVILSSDFKFDNNKPLKLAFVRFKKSATGVSVNDIKMKLLSEGYDKLLLEKQFFDRGLFAGSRMLDNKYEILEIRIYEIDSTFPRITANSFKGNMYPDNIVQISYTVDLSSVSYTILD